MLRRPAAVKFFAALLSENGTVSATRFCMIAWFAVMISAWAKQSLATGTLAEIPATVLTFSGLMLGAKVVQKITEK